MLYSTESTLQATIPFVTVSVRNGHSRRPSHHVLQPSPPWLAAYSAQVLEALEAGRPAFQSSSSLCSFMTSGNRLNCDLIFSSVKWE